MCGDIIELGIDMKYGVETMLKLGNILFLNVVRKNEITCLYNSGN